MMYSLKELTNCCWRMEEDLTHNWKHSHPITYTSETPVKKEKAESPLNVINHQSVTLPQESSSPANIFSANQLIDMPESLPQGAFREELMGAQINSHICKLPPRNDGGTQTDELHPGKINGKTAMDLMDTEVRSGIPLSQSNLYFRLSLSLSCPWWIWALRKAMVFNLIVVAIGMLKVF